MCGIHFIYVFCYMTVFSITEAETKAALQPYLRKSLACITLN